MRGRQAGHSRTTFSSELQRHIGVSTSQVQSYPTIILQLSSFNYQSKTSKLKKKKSKLNQER